MDLPHIGRETQEQIVGLEADKGAFRAVEYQNWQESDMIWQESDMIWQELDMNWQELDMIWHTN